MKKIPLQLKSGLTLLTLTTFFCVNQPASAQSTPAQDTRPAQDRDTTRGELLSFDNFLDQHREIAEQLRKNPSLLNDKEFVKTHPALQDYLQNHPGVREEIRENPNAFMRAENRFDRHEDNRNRDITRGELLSFDNFLDQHREIAEQVRKNPSLVNNEEFLKNHPALQDYLQNRPGVREEIRENPNAFVHAENRFDRQESNRDRGDITRGELMSFDNFLDKHREISEQLHKNPSLVNNQEFVKNHPALQDYLQNHPGVREEIRENPNVFMKQEARYDRHEEGFDPGQDRHGTDIDRDHGTMHRRFGEFLGGHSELAEQLSKNPSQVKNQEFLENHPELKEYLNAHPNDRQELMANPDRFIKSSQQFTNNSQTAKPPAAKPKPNQ
jgi:hypothetical protein